MTQDVRVLPLDETLPSEMESMSHWGLPIIKLLSDEGISILKSMQKQVNLKCGQVNQKEWK